jgi:hypothetical protein
VAKISPIPIEGAYVLEVAKGRCNGHLLRRCKELHDVLSAKEQPYLESLSALLQEAIDLARLLWPSSDPQAVPLVALPGG